MRIVSKENEIPTNKIGLKKHVVRFKNLSVDAYSIRSIVFYYNFEGVVFIIFKTIRGF
jgi:hypothetical protein